MRPLVRVPLKPLSTLDKDPTIVPLPFAVGARVRTSLGSPGRVLAAVAPGVWRIQVMLPNALVHTSTYSDKGVPFDEHSTWTIEQVLPPNRDLFERVHLGRFEDGLLPPLDYEYVPHTPTPEQRARQVARIRRMGDAAKMAWGWQPPHWRKPT